MQCPSHVWTAYSIGADLNWKVCLIYLDNIIVYVQTAMNRWIDSSVVQDTESELEVEATQKLCYEG